MMTPEERRAYLEENAQAAEQIDKDAEEEFRLASGERIGEDDTHKTKDASEFGFRENLQEAANVVTGAVRDEVSSVLTAPERIFDMFSGMMMQT